MIHTGCVVYGFITAVLVQSVSGSCFEELPVGERLEQRQEQEQGGLYCATLPGWLLTVAVAEGRDASHAGTQQHLRGTRLLNIPQTSLWEAWAARRPRRSYDIALVSYWQGESF
jgi:hypothetical protein